MIRRDEEGGEGKERSEDRNGGEKKERRDEKWKERRERGKGLEEESRIVRKNKEYKRVKRKEGARAWYE